MGEHKRNPTAIAAKNGVLLPKPQRKTKKEMDCELNAMVMEAMMKKVPASAYLMALMNSRPLRKGWDDIG